MTLTRARGGRHRFDPEADPRGHPHGPLRPPGDTSGLLGVVRRPYLLKLLVRKELRVRYQQSLLGLAWSYIKPLVRFVVYFVVIGIVLGMTRRVENFPIHIFAGLVVVGFFTEVLSSGSQSVLKNKSLVRKMNLPRETFPVASLLVTAYHLIPMYVVLIGGALLTGYEWDPVTLGAFALSMSLIFTFALAVVLATSALTVYFRDFKNIIEVISMLIMWSTPMIYDWQLISERLGGTWWEQVYLANPAAVGVMISQRAFWVPTLENPQDPANQPLMPENIYERGLIMLGISVVLVFLAQRLFVRLEKRFAEQL